VIDFGIWAEVEEVIGDGVETWWDRVYYHQESSYMLLRVATESDEDEIGQSLSVHVHSAYSS
jgi:hypothetical protein